MKKKVLVDKQDWEDIRDQMDFTRCIGGRLVPVESLYLCPHCDAEEPSKKCLAPRRKTSEE